MTTVVLEPSPRGHRLMYVARLAAGLGRRRWIWVTSAEAISSEEARVHLADAPQPSSTPIASPTSSARERLRLALRVARRAASSNVLVPDGDKYLKAALFASLTLLGRRVRLTLLLMRTAPEEGLHPRLRRFGKLVLANIVSIFPSIRVLRLVDFSGSDSDSILTRRLPAVPDAVPIPPAKSWPALERLVPKDAFMVLVAGVVDSRKNAALVYRALSEYDPAAFLVVAGSIPVDIQDELRKLEGDVGKTRARLVLIARTLEDYELFALVERANVLSLLYDNDGPSGLLAIACQTRTPVLASDLPLLAETVGRLHLGATSSKDVRQLVATLSRLSTFRPDPPTISSDGFAAMLLGGTA